ncbi:MAG: hypothetical protein M1822_002550 [Bathelium mastoideum]|nr:MAG: hypothetical protein M1822_002550 [Bathelium mastoideum]
MSAYILHRAHEYFRHHQYAFPLNNDDCAFQWTFNTKESYFDRIHGDPEKSRDFNAFMSANRSSRKHWTDWYPTEKEIVKNFSTEYSDIMLVDIGGGKGHDLTKFLAKHPQAKGHLMLQDLPEVIAEAALSEEDGIYSVAHDFLRHNQFTVCDQILFKRVMSKFLSGARVYYTHFVMHNWPDERGRDILLNIKSAMKPGYSQLLLNESVLPDRDCPPFFAGIDWNMMALSAGMERTYRQWAELIDSVGMQLVQIRVSPFKNDLEGIIQAMVPE